MPSYEELYNIAKQNYRKAVDERDELKKNLQNLQQQKQKLSGDLLKKQAVLTAIQAKKSLIQDALDKCQSILSGEGEFQAMKKSLELAGQEYAKIISSDGSVADLISIYADDFTNTQNGLSAIQTDLQNKLKTLEEEEKTANKEVTDCQNQLNTVNSGLNNSGSEWYAQRKIDQYYTEMKTYEQKWLNGE